MPTATAIRVPQFGCLLSDTRESDRAGEAQSLRVQAHRLQTLRAGSGGLDVRGPGQRHCRDACYALEALQQFENNENGREEGAMEIASNGAGTQ
jgi:hypothetical protein